MEHQSPTKSKKFIAFLIAEATWKLLLLGFLVLLWNLGEISTVSVILLLAVTIVSGFLEVGYILGQASLDKYIKIAQIAASSGKEFSTKSMEMTSKSKKDG